MDNSAAPESGNHFDEQSTPVCWYRGWVLVWSKDGHDGKGTRSVADGGVCGLRGHHREISFYVPPAAEFKRVGTTEGILS